jgi:SAM-dependent methyltransferase
MIHLDSDEDFETVTKCRICESPDLHEILNLGEQPLANALRTHEDNSVEKIFPLVLSRCRSCTTVQLSINVNPKLMFQDYFWVTGTTATAREHCSRLASEISKISSTNPSILEIGSNDGTLLKEFQKFTSGGLYGVDPAIDISRSIKIPGINVITDFFTSSFASDFEQAKGLVDVVIARNVLSHVPDLRDVFLGIDKILSPSGIFVVEFHEASRILSELHYDSIYHEHTFYHSIRSMTEAQATIGLVPFDILESPISGGSHILISSRVVQPPTARFLTAIQHEETSNVQSESAWMNFARLSNENLEEIRDFLKNNTGTSIKAFGASARSSTLLNAIGTPAKALSGIADNNPLKWGKVSPGTHLPIKSPKEMINDSIEMVFICPFNFEAEIVDYLNNTLGWHGSVYLPLPGKPRIYTI